MRKLIYVLYSAGTRRHNMYRHVKPLKYGDGSCNFTLRTYSTTLYTIGPKAP